MIFKKFFQCIFVCIPFLLKAQADLKLLYEKRFTSETGAANLLTLHKGFNSLEEKYLVAAPFSTSKKSNKLVNAAYRAIKTAVLDYPVDYLFGLTQHEIFGHGARFNEFNYDDCSFHLSLPFPYGKGHGFAEGYPPLNSTLDERMAMIISGNESNTVLSALIRANWVESESIHYRDFLLYAGGFHNTTQYIFTNIFKSYGDINAYQLYIREKYFSTTGKEYKIRDLALFSAINILDPYQYIAFYHWANYILSGKTEGKLPFFKVGKLKYMPSFNLGLSPFGAEFYFNNYFKTVNHQYKIMLRCGDPRFEVFYGAGLKLTNILHSKKLSADADLELWKQPEMNLQDSQTKFRTTHEGAGILLSTTIKYSIFEKINLILMPGYKTDGFVQGEHLSKGLFLRGGFGLTDL